MTSPAGTVSLNASETEPTTRPASVQRLLGLGGGAREIGDLDLLGAEGHEEQHGRALVDVLAGSRVGPESGTGGHVGVVAFEDLADGEAGGLDGGGGIASRTGRARRARRPVRCPGD